MFYSQILYGESRLSNRSQDEKPTETTKRSPNSLELCRTEAYSLPSDCSERCRELCWEEGADKLKTVAALAGADGSYVVAGAGRKVQTQWLGYLGCGGR